MAYWVSLYSIETWTASLDHDQTVCGFTDSMKHRAAKLRPGDILLCYVKGLKRFVAAKRVLSPAYEDDTPLFGKYDCPWKVKVAAEVTLDLETGVPVDSLKGLSIFQHGKDWGISVRQGLNAWSDTDGNAVLDSLLAAKASPVILGIPATALRQKTVLKMSDSLGLVSVPEPEEAAPPVPAVPDANGGWTDHTEVQWLLLDMGSRMGLSVWAPKADRGKAYSGKPLGSVARMLDKLPLNLDDASRATAEQIDVLWIAENSIYAAFEIESTTAIYSGLLRMSDLQVMLPHLLLPIYIVAPDQRFDKVTAEILRPTFSALRKPLKTICKIVRFSRLAEFYAKHQDMLDVMKAEALDKIAEKVGDRVSV